MPVPFFSSRDVRAAVSPLEAHAAVRDAFVAYARGEWTMQPKLFVGAYPAGDFRAMPALGGSHAVLKWVTSFPGNPFRGLPTVTGIVLLSDAETGMLEAILDAASVTALRTAAAAVLAAETLQSPDATTHAVVGCGVNGLECVRMLVERDTRPLVWDVDAARRTEAADRFGVPVAQDADDALSSDVVITVTPGHQILYPAGSLRPGQHVSLMGADGPGKAEIAVEELTRARVFCDAWEQSSPNGISKPRVRLFVDDWEQASHGGETAAAVKAAFISQEDVTELGAVLTGHAPGRQHEDDITLFDSTGLAIQDLAIAKVALSKVNELDLQTLDL